MTITSKTILRNALLHGFAVIPLLDRSKKPAVEGGVGNFSRSPQDVTNHWEAHPNNNYGVVTGAPSGIFVLDIDGPKGEIALASLESIHGSLPKTTQVQTAQGRHLYFQHPGKRVRNSAGTLGEGIDVRGDGGYVVGVGSVHPSGHVYCYAAGRDPAAVGIAQAPIWLEKRAIGDPLHFRNPYRPRGPRETIHERHRNYAASALRKECQRLIAAPAHQRNNTLNGCAFNLGQLVGAGVLDESTVIEYLRRGAAKIGLEPEEIERTLTSGLNAGKAQPRVLPPMSADRSRGPTEAGDSEPGAAADPLTQQLARLGQDDTANAERLLARYRDRLVYCPGKGWLIYDGRRWTLDGEARRKLFAQATADAIGKEGAFLNDTKAQDDRFIWRRYSRSAQGIERMLKMAEPMMVVRMDQLDADPWLLNVENGTIDLRSGCLEPHDPADMITMIAPVMFAPWAPAPVFTRFMARILDKDRELFEFLQRAVGYTLTGMTGEQILLYCKGEQANGKSTLVNSIRDMLGDYGRHTPTETLLVKRYDNAIPNDLARLVGARMVVAVEVAAGKQLDEARVKSITGGEPIAARFLHKEYFEFQPAFKLWLVANDDPRIRGTDDALWRRIRVIPFNVIIPPDERDPQLPEKLKAEWPGILAWAVRGCLQWQKIGLKPPKAVMKASGAYRDRADHLRRFLLECLIEDPEEQTASTVVLSAYRAWCLRNNERPLGAPKFKAQLTVLGFEHVKVQSGHFWKGLRIRR